MKYRCPYCEGSGDIQEGLNATYIAEDGELCIAKCKSCKEEFSVAFTISQAPDLSDLKGLSQEEMLSKLFGGKIYKNNR